MHPQAYISDTVPKVLCHFQNHKHCLQQYAVMLLVFSMVQLLMLMTDRACYLPQMPRLLDLQGATIMPVLFSVHSDYLLLY